MQDVMELDVNWRNMYLEGVSKLRVSWNGKRETRVSEDRGRAKSDGGGRVL